MKIFITLTVCFIAGVHGLAIAPVTRGPLQILDLLGYANTTTDEIEDYNKLLCDKNGGPQAYNEFVNKRQQFETCRASVETEIMGETPEGEEELSTSGATAFYARKICGKWPKYENCLNNFTGTAKTCLDAPTVEAYELTYNTFMSIAQFLCRDDAIGIRTLLPANDTECLRSKSIDLLRCAENTIIKFVRETVSGGAEAGGLGIFNSFIPDVNKCNIFNQYEVCFVDVLESCPEGASVARVSSSIFQIVNNVTTCDHLLQSTTSTAAPSSEKNTL